MNKHLLSEFAMTISVSALLFASCKKEIPMIESEEPSSQAAEIRTDKSVSTVPSPGAQVTNNINSIHPDFKLYKRSPIPFRQFEMKDKNGKSIPPNQLITLKNGSKITAQEYFTQLNDLEQKMNAQGYSLRTKETVLVSETVTESKYLDGAVASQPQPIGQLRVGRDLEDFMSTRRKVGNVELKPIDEYTPAEQDAMKNILFESNGDNMTARILGKGEMVAPIPDKVFIDRPIPLKRINNSAKKEWKLGKESTFLAAIVGELGSVANIYPYDPQKPDNCLSEFKVNAKGKVYGVVFSHSVTLLNAEAEFYAPARSEKKMTAKLRVDVGSLTVYNLSQSYAQRTDFKGRKYRSVNKSFPVEVPIFAGLDFSGRIGVRGDAGIDYTATITRGYAKAKIDPFAQLNGYAEAGVRFLGVLGGGVGGDLTFIKGKLNLNGSIYLAAQNAKQIVVGYAHYFGIDASILGGRLYCYAEVCVPIPFVDDLCSRKEHDFFKWSGIKIKGTIWEVNKYVTIANL